MHSGSNRNTSSPADPSSVILTMDSSTANAKDGGRSGRGMTGHDNPAYTSYSDAGIAVGYNDNGGGKGYSGNGGIGGSGEGGGGGGGRSGGRRTGDGYGYTNTNTCGWPERDIADYAAIEDDEEFQEAGNRCLGEARLNCNRFWSALAEQGEVLKHTMEKKDIRKAAASLISMESLKQRVPIVAWAPKYNLDDLQGDLIAGVTVGLTLIPQAIAYAGIANLDSQYGLYSSFIGPFIYLVLGCSKDIALGPSAIASLMTLNYGKPFFGKDPTMAIWLGFYTGIVQLIMYFIGFGYVMEFISFPVLKAFSVAASITIGMSQVKKWWGLKGIPGDFIPQLVKTIGNIPKTRLYDFLLGVVSIFFIVLFKKLKEIKWKTKYEDLPTKMKILNKALWFIGTSRNTIVIICTSIAAYIFEVGGLVPFSLTGYIPPGIPSWQVPPTSVTDPATNITYTTADVPGRIGHGFIVVPLICVIEGLSIGKVCGRKFDYKYDTNQEFLPYGIANVLGAFVQGYPAAGTYSRTAVNAASGSRTPAGNIVTAALVLIALQFLTPLFYYIPHASLAVVIIMAVIDTITFHKVWVFWKIKRIDLVPWIVTFILSFVLSVEYGIAIGCLVQLLIMLYDTWRPTIKVYEYESCSGGKHRSYDSSQYPKIIIAELSISLFYPAVEHIKETVISIAQKEMPKGVVIDFSHVADVDSSAVQGIRELLIDFNKKGIKLVACNLQKRAAIVFKRAKPKNFVMVATLQQAIDMLADGHSGNSDVGNTVAVNASLAAYSAETECSKANLSDYADSNIAGMAQDCALTSIMYTSRF